MHALAFVAGLVLAADSGGGSIDPVGDDVVGAEIDCDGEFDEDALDDTAVGMLAPWESLTADPGGGWWWIRADRLSTDDPTTLLLVDVDTGVEHALRGAAGDDADTGLEWWTHGHATQPLRDVGAFQTLALRSPDDAIANARYELRRGDVAVVDLEILFADTTPPRAPSLTIGVDGVITRACTARCDTDTIEAARIPIVVLDYEGDPAVLDVELFAACPGADGAYGGSMFVDAWAIGPTYGEARVVDLRDRGVFVSGCTLSILRAVVWDAAAHEVLLDVGDAIATDRALPDGEDRYVDETGAPVALEPCTGFEGTIYDDRYRRSIGCPCACTTPARDRPFAVAVLAVVAGALGARRRRRRVAR